MFILTELDYVFFKNNICWLLFKHVLFSDFLFALKIVYIFIFRGSNKAKILLSPYVELYNLDVFVNQKFLSFLELQKDAHVILVSNVPSSIANKITEKFKIFSSFISYSELNDNTETSKLNKIIEVTNNEPFFYVGNSNTDIVIFQEAAKIGIVDPDIKILNKVKTLKKEYIVFFS